MSNSILLKNNVEFCYKFYCNNCDYGTSKKSSYNDHLLSAKHQLIPKHKSIIDKKTKFYCDNCDYGTNNKTHMNSHNLTAKHLKQTIISNIIINTDESKSSSEYICLNCNKKYKDYSGLWRHKKKCQQMSKDYTEPSINELVTKLINQNSELQQMLIEQNNKIFELAKEAKNITNNVNTTNNNNNNNTFNLQFYLNDTCKDAISLVDFADSLQVQLDDLEETARLGYSEGVSRIIINGLNELEVCKRPIHCSDAKRETLYIKDQNEWLKEDTTKSHLSKAIKTVSKKNVQQIFEWQKKYPEYKDPDSKQSDRYMEMICNTMNGSSTQEQEQNLNKIIKNVTKEVVIDKNM
jgi:hypothetical protein